MAVREIEKALRRAQRSEMALRKERDMLEIKVEKRTQELKQAQIEKMAQVYRFAEFGQLTTGLFHDLVNPLNLVSLNLDRLTQESKQVEQKEIQQLITRAVNGTRRLERFILAARRQMQNQEVLESFSLNGEIAQVIQILGYKTKRANVIISLDAQKNIVMFANPVKFSQLMTNLISNAVDAYAEVSQGDKVIKIILQENDGSAHITIQDWGIGISSKLLPHIFEPLFTTKSIDKGMGMGLAISRNIVEQSFGGTIEVKSKRNKGTIFTITFPLKKPSTGKTKKTV